MTLDWGSSAREMARHAQAQRGWSDEQLLDRLLDLVRLRPSPDLRHAGDALQEAYDALPAEAGTSERIELLTDRVPALHGPWGTELLSDLLLRSR